MNNIYTEHGKSKKPVTVATADFRQFIVCFCRIHHFREFTETMHTGKMPFSVNLEHNILYIALSKLEWIFVSMLLSVHQVFVVLHKFNIFFLYSHILPKLNYRFHTVEPRSVITMWPVKVLKQKSYGWMHAIRYIYSYECTRTSNELVPREYSILTWQYVEARNSHRIYKTFCTVWFDHDITHKVHEYAREKCGWSRNSQQHNHQHLSSDQRIEF